MEYEYNMIQLINDNTIYSYYFYYALYMIECTIARYQN